MPELLALNEKLNTPAPIVTHLSPVDFPEFISKHPVTVLMNADGDNNIINSTWCVQVQRSPKEASAAAMQSWRERCEKFVCLQGDYVEK